MTKILVIEDDVMLLSSVMEILELNGYSTVGAESGAQGLQLARDCQPDLILTDVHMPTMNGIQMIKRLRQEPTTQYTPIIIMTASDDMPAFSDIHDHADSFMRKPFDPNHLLAQIDMLLSVRSA
jgi:CheY-like chemotaxis protein